MSERSALGGSLLPVTLSDGAEVVLRRLGETDGKIVVVGHGNGFATDAFRLMAQRLAETCDVFLFDQRNHGRNGRHDPASHTVARLQRDLPEVLDAIQARAPGRRPLFGLFHSISGLNALRMECQDQHRFAALALMEPPLSPPESHPLHQEQIAFQEALADRTLRRKGWFDSPAAYASRLRGRPAFARLAPGALEDLSRAVLRPGGDSGWALVCPPELEARIYRENLDHGLYDDLAAAGLPVLVIAGAAPSLRARICEDMAVRGGFDLLRLVQVTHLMPMERPRLLADLATAYFDEAGRDRAPPA